MLTFQNLKIIIAKYSYRILLFFVFYHGLIRPLQIIIADKIVKPLIEKKITNERVYDLKANKHHLTIYKSDKNINMHFSIPFGQAYFFLIFFLWFKPQNLTVAMSIYNLSLIPIYTLSIIFFLNGYFIFGELVTINEKFYRLIYLLIFLLRIIRPDQFNLLFNSPKNQHSSVIV
jgi:hypothetical protein